MKIETSSLVHVYYKPKAEKTLVGRLAIKEKKIFFEYSKDFLKSGLELSPFNPPLNTGIFEGDSSFDGFFGIFNDSLPDGWGRLLLERALVKHRLNSGNLTALGRLCFMCTNFDYGIRQKSNFKNLFEMAKTYGRRRNRALEAIEEVSASIPTWSLFTKESGVSAKSRILIDSEFKKTLVFAI